MTPDEILELPPLALQQAQRQFFYDEGYLVFPSLVPRGLLADLRAGVSDVVETTRNLTVSSDAFDLEPSHSAEAPRLRRAAYVDDLAPVFWDLCRNSILTDIAVDLLGPNLRFRDMMINFKWARGGAEVKCHQDIVFYHDQWLADYRKYIASKKQQKEGSGSASLSSDRPSSSPPPSQACSPDARSTAPRPMSAINVASMRRYVSFADSDDDASI